MLYGPNSFVIASDASETAAAGDHDLLKPLTTGTSPKGRRGNGSSSLLSRVIARDCASRVSQQANSL
jgi:hypothetical protein